jgi:hypothetical protein
MSTLMLVSTNIMLCNPRLFILSLAPSRVLSVPDSSQGFVALGINGEQITLLARYQLPDRARCRIASGL